MKPGPQEIYQCPNCKNLISRGSLRSGNTFGAKLYSDGKRIAPMLPEFPSIAICPKCATIFWLDKDKLIGSHDFEDSLENIFGDSKNESEDSRNAEWENTTEARFLTIDEYFTALENKIYNTKEEELFIRVRIWWGFNDRIRNNEALFKAEHEEYLWNLNSNSLMKLLDENNINQKIMIAELYRNKGEFTKCLEILNSIDDEDLNWLKFAIEKECSRQNTKVFKISE